MVMNYKAIEISNFWPATPVRRKVYFSFFCSSATVQDNALVIHDYNGFNIWVNGQKAATNVAANDGKWHHMALTWLSSTGAWKVYKDGSKVRENDVAIDAFQKGQVGDFITLCGLQTAYKTIVVSVCVCTSLFQRDTIIAVLLHFEQC